MHYRGGILGFVSIAAIKIETILREDEGSAIAIKRKGSIVANEGLFSCDKKVILG